MNDQPKWWEVLIFAGLIMAAIFVLSITACSHIPQKSPPRDTVVTPIAAINVSKCGGSVALYVIIDANHVIRFDQNQTTLFTFDHGQMSQTDGPPTPYKDALSLAQSAGITTNATVACDRVET